MQTRYKVILCIIVVLTSFAFGRYSTPVIVKTERVEVEKKTETSTDDLNRHKETTTKEVVKPDGSKETTTTTTEDTSRRKDKKDTEDTQKSDKTETVKSKDVVTLSALAMVSVTNPTGIDYGLHVSKPMIGPIVVGIFGFTDGRVGVSLGLQF